MQNGTFTAWACNVLVVAAAALPACSSGPTACEPSASCTSAPLSPPPGCVPNELAGPVVDACGIFVSRSLGHDSSDGSRAHPLRTLAKAIALSGTEKPVYACAEQFQETLVIPAGTTVYGGLDCLGAWTYAGDTKKTIIQSGPDAGPLRLSSGSSTTRMEDVTVRAPNAVAAGRSSIAVIVDGAAAVFVRSEIVAGNGAAGKAGEIPHEVPAAGAPGMTGTDACIDPVSIDGGPGGQSECGSVSDGGKGGTGGIPGMNNDDGAAGSNGLPADPMKGLGGAGDTGAACEPGYAGKNGIAGTAGEGGTGVGVVSPSGFIGADGRPGTAGTPGQGGGGGGGARAGQFCGQGTMMGTGASGGGGGGGGCGGKGGGGGKAGGSSIAMISLKGRITLVDTTLSTGKGGTGGTGAVGQSGGAPGAAGAGGKASGVAPSAAGCTGGSGGAGGPGGSGGGGRGGHAIGVALSGGTLEGGSFAIGHPGEGGEGGPGTSEASRGALGLSGEIVQF